MLMFVKFTYKYSPLRLSLCQDALKITALWAYFSVEIIIVGLTLHCGPRLKMFQCILSILSD